MASREIFEKFKNYVISVLFLKPLDGLLLLKKSYKVQHGLLIMQAYLCLLLLTLSDVSISSVPFHYTGFSSNVIFMFKTSLTVQSNLPNFQKFCSQYSSYFCYWIHHYLKIWLLLLCLLVKSYLSGWLLYFQSPEELLVSGRDKKKYLLNDEVCSLLILLP